MNPYEELAMLSIGYSVEEVEKWKGLTKEGQVKVMRAVSCGAEATAKGCPPSPEYLGRLFDESGHPLIAAHCYAAYLLGQDPFK